MAEAAEVGELDHLRLIAGQAADRAADLTGRLALQRLVLGPLAGDALLEDRVVVEVERRPRGLAAQQVGRPVADDAEHPGADAAASPVVAGAAAPDRDERLLDD